MTRRTLKADLAVIGAGAGGLSVAAGAAQLGLKVVLFEQGEMGGDCLNYGCVPSKALIAAAEAAHHARKAGPLGVAVQGVSVNFGAVMEHVRRTIDTIAPNDSQERFERLGVQVVREAAYFLDARTVATDQVLVRPRKTVIATGSHPAVPPIPGLDQVAFLTNETVFELDELPRRLIVLGGGPIGLELGQAFRRLGSEVVVVEALEWLAREDREAAGAVVRQLRCEGVELLAGHRAVHAQPGVTLQLEGPDGPKTISGSHLLVAVGRAPSIGGLALEKAGIAHSAAGVTTDRSLRTTNPRVFAIGDVAGRGQFTHLAGAHAALFIRRALFGLPIDAGRLAVPRVTYTDPEIAAIGLREAEARARFGSVRVETVEFADNDRALTEAASRGFGRLVTTPKGRILGVTLVGRHAGDHIHLWSLALSSGLKLSQVAGMIAPYPTRGEINKRLAGQWFSPALFSKRTRALVSVLKHFV